MNGDDRFELCQLRIWFVFVGALFGVLNATLVGELIWARPTTLEIVVVCVAGGVAGVAAGLWLASRIHRR